MHVQVKYTLWGFGTGKFQHRRQTAGQLQSMLRVNKASAKVFEPRAT